MIQYPRIASCAEEAVEIARKEKRHVLFGRPGPSKCPAFRMPDLHRGGMSEKEILRHYHGLAPRFTTPTTSPKWGTSAAITITLNSLATSTTVGRQGTVIDNTGLTILPDDFLITTIISTSSSAIGSSKTVAVYISGSEDGTNFDQDDGVMGASDAAYTINLPTNLKTGVIMYCPTASKVYNATFPLAGLWAGAMPRKWVPVACNDTNQSLKSTGNSMSYSQLNEQIPSI